MFFQLWGFKMKSDPLAINIFGFSNLKYSRNEPEIKEQVWYGQLRLGGRYMGDEEGIVNYVEEVVRRVWDCSRSISRPEKQWGAPRTGVSDG